MNNKKTVSLFLGILVGSYAAPSRASAQQAPAPSEPEQPLSPYDDLPADEDGASKEDAARDLADELTQAIRANQSNHGLVEEPVRHPRKPPPKVNNSQIINSPTAYLLPAAVLRFSGLVDTGGGLGGSANVGLGDVGEFGISSTPLMRFRLRGGEPFEEVQPFFMAHFKMGVAEERLFDHQPALAIGFKKSFTVNAPNHDLRAAAIEVTASKQFHKVNVHLGGVFWDASIEPESESLDDVFLHGQGKRRQIRPFGGLVAEPIDDAQLMVDLYWVPRFDPSAGLDRTKIKLRPALSWGVRYKLGERASIESGVRVPDIAEANLLDAQIFGQVSLNTTVLRDILGLDE